MLNMQGKAKQDKYLIDSLWVLDINSGIVIFEENYSDFTKEGMTADLMSAFLSALLSFTEESFTSNIEHIKLSDRKILFEPSEYVLFVVSQKDFSIGDKRIMKLIKDISDKFGEKYNSFFERTDHFDGRIKRFQGFSKDLREIVKIEPLSVKFLRSLDFKENVKKADNFIQRRKERLKNLLERKEKIDKFFSAFSSSSKKK